MTITKVGFFGGLRDEGIFARDEDEPAGAAGDSAAVEELRLEARYTGQPLVLVRGEDGLPIPATQDQPVPPARVDEDVFVCLSCDHYIEAIAAIAEYDGKRVREVHRYCSLLKAWAELCDLTDARVFACSGHTRAPAPVQYRGLCAHGPCAHCVELRVQGPTDAEPATARWCTRLAGAARLFELSERVVEACNVWAPRRVSASTVAAAQEAVRVSEEVRRERAGIDDDVQG